MGNLLLHAQGRVPLIVSEGKVRCMNWMRLIRRAITVSVAIMLISSFLIYNIEADSSQVEVTIPSFGVTINSDSIDSTRMEYPLIVYKDITYFPLTWDWCNELGLISVFTNKDGLYIANYTSYIKPVLDSVHQSGNFKEDIIYNPTMPTYPIHINGQVIENNDEAYPLLNFQGITYFPLTWRFVREEFAWDMTWSDDTGFELSSARSLHEYEPGEHYSNSYFFTLEDYIDFSIIRKITESWSVGTEAKESGNYGYHKEGREDSYYQLDYATDTMTQVYDQASPEPIYNSGAVSRIDVDDLFEVLDNVIYFEGEAILNVTELAEEKGLAYKVYVHKFSVNELDVYDLTVFYSEETPAPYSPRSSFVFIDDGGGILQKVESWPMSHPLSEVYPYGSEGLYLCSNSRYFGSARYSNGCGWVTIIDSDLTEVSLNDSYEDWNSLDALGMDDEGNLYLRNTWFPEFKFANQYNGRVSLINDGFFRLGINGELSKIYPFIAASDVTVTPTGEIYVDAEWTEAIIHIQTGTRIEVD